MKTLGQLHEALAATSTIRMHNRPTIKDNNVGHHTCNMLIIAYHVYGGRAPHDLIKAITFHDLHEWRTGDIPYFTKRHPKLKTPVRDVEREAEHEMGIDVPLRPYLTAVLNVIDTMEFMYYMQCEYLMGNQLAYEPWCDAEKVTVNNITKVLSLDNPYMDNPVPKMKKLLINLQPTK